VYTPVVEHPASSVMFRTVRAAAPRVCKTVSAASIRKRRMSRRMSGVDVSIEVDISEVT
jgi:hypothetical protein